MIDETIFMQLHQLSEIEDALDAISHGHSTDQLEQILNLPSYNEAIKNRFPFFSRSEILSICKKISHENSYWRLLHPSGDIIIRCRTQKATFLVPGVHVTMAWAGSLLFHVDNQSFELKQGDIIICNDNVSYSFEPIDNKALALDFVMSAAYLQNILMNRLPGTSLSNDFFARNLYNSSSTKDFLYINTSKSTLASDLLARATIEFTAKSYFTDEVVNSYILLLFVEIARCYADICVIKTNEGHEYEVREIISFIQEHPDSATAASVAEHFHFSTSYLSTLLKKYSGYSFKTHLLKARLSKAAILLRHTDFPILEVAESVGYKNMNHFYTLFREQYGCTPGEYRANGESIV